MDESRKQFEAEMEKLGDCVDMRRAKNGDEEYVAWDALLAWKMWQASRAAIEITAPRFIGSREALAKGFTVDYSNGFGDAMDAYEENIRAAGIKVKE